MSNEEQERTMKFEVSDEQLARLRAKLDGMNKDIARDTQFAGFAKSLWEKLCDANGHGYIDVNKFDDDGIDPVNYRLIIAQSAYDFVCHVIEAYEPHLSTDDMVRAIPDMPQWPEETTP